MMLRSRGSAAGDRNFGGMVRQRQQQFQERDEDSVPSVYSPGPASSSLSPRRSASTARQMSSDNSSYVWIRVDAVDAIWNNHGTLPRGWTPPSSRKRGRDKSTVAGAGWDWVRALVVQTSGASSDSRPSSPHRYRAKQNARTVVATFTVQDEEFAPSHLRNATVSLSYDPSDIVDPLVCDANTWWTRRDGTPPDDLTVLTHLHEPAVVYCLQERYRQDAIYTYTGKILLALNPFRSLDRIYSEKIMERYWQGDTLERPPPHVYAIAQDAYRSMLVSMGDRTPGATTDQSILVSGESGSGKTVTTKIIMGYLATQSQRMSSAQNTEMHREGIESQILQSNPILESFGNARTVRNDNSSRFGKFMELLFTSSGTLVSASIETYLLEKVRLISQAPGERNYHVFYEILAGLPQKERQALKIGNVTARDFRMTASSGTFDRRDGVEDRETYQQLRKALDTVGFTKEEQLDMMSVACALLHTSNIDLRELTTAGGEEGSELVQSSSLRSALELWGVPVEALNNSLCVCAIEARGEVFHKNLTVAQARKALEALIKATYGALFTHIVQKVNQSIAVEHGASHHMGRLSRIGVLDIFGFESFQVNSFEQLCINYCNEALQQLQNRFVFKLEQEEYDREGIEWSFIEFPDNQDILDLIENRRGGILSILDEQSRLATCTDATFCRTVHDKCKEHPRFSGTMTERSNLAFSIQHYAGPVTYDARNFLEKNKDELPKETTELLTSSSVPFLSYLGELLKEGALDDATVNPQRCPSPTSSVSSYTRDRAAISPMNKKQLHRGSSSILRESVGSQFSQQLRELRRRIEATTPHYVRCLKPNDELIPNQFQPHILADQLRCAGVLEAIRVSRVGFPHRYFHESFIHRYGVLVRSRLRGRGHGAPSVRCRDVVNSLLPQVVDVFMQQAGAASTAQIRDLVSLGMQMGRSKVFLRRPVFEALEFLRNMHLEKCAVAVQKHIRRFLAQLHYYDVFMAAVTIQAFARRIIATRRVCCLREQAAATKIQSAFRRFVAEYSFMAARLIANFCQAYGRGVIARKLYAILRVEMHALAIQRCWRRHYHETGFVAMRSASIVIQCCWRQRQAKLILRELRLEARDLDAVAAERDRFREESLKLRKEVEMLRRSRMPVDDETESRKSQSVEWRTTREVDPVSVYEAEVEHLRTEVERLQAALARQSEILNPVPLRRREDQPPEAVIVRKMSTWSLFGSKKDDTASQASSLGNTYSPHSPPPTLLPTISRSSTFSRREGLPESPPRRREMIQGEVTPMSWHSSGVNPAMSSSSVSLLDAERHTEIADYHLESTSGSPGRNSSRIYATTTMMTPRPAFEEDPLPLEERRGFEFADELRWLHQSINDKDYRRVSDILKTSEEPHVLVNEIGEDGRTALHIAVATDDVKISRLLLENGAIVNSQDSNGDTPLHLAGGPPMTHLLLETGRANPNIPNIDGICALHIAVQRRDSGSVRVLLKHYAKVDTADNLRWLTPIHLVAMPDTIETSSDRARAVIAGLLCSVDACDLNYQDSEGNTPLHYAVQIETPDAGDVVNALLEKGASPRIPNSRSQEPLLLLCNNNALRNEDVYQECLHAMLFHGADPNQQSSTGATPLHLSLFHRDIDSAVQLVNRAAELHLLWRKPKRWTAFWDEMGTSEVLALDMVVDDHSLHRILAAITRPPKLAPTRPWCMHCKSPLGSISRALHCRHCGRHICSACSRCRLAPDYFPKSFEIFDPSWVCIVCEKILVSRKEDNSNSTQPMSSSLDDEDERLCSTQYEF